MNGTQARLSFWLPALATLGALSTGRVARGEELPPTVLFSDLIKLGDVDEAGGVAAPRDFRIVYTGSGEIEVNYWLYEGEREDPAKRILGGGEDGKWCYVEKREPPYWLFTHCFDQRPTGGQTRQGDNLLKPGKYTHILYWRLKGTREWRPMNVLHFTVEAAQAATDGRFAGAAKVYTVDTHERAAAIVLEPGKDVVAVSSSLGTVCAPGETRFHSWIGLFFQGRLEAVATPPDDTEKCSLRSYRAGEALSRPKVDGRTGGKSFRPEDLLGKDGTWTLVVVANKLRRTWDVVVKGGKIELPERQRASFRPFHYQWVENTDLPGQGVYWLSPGIEQPLNVP